MFPRDFYLILFENWSPREVFYDSAITTRVDLAFGDDVIRYLHRYAHHVAYHHATAP